MRTFRLAHFPQLSRAEPSPVVDVARVHALSIGCARPQVADAARASGACATDLCAEAELLDFARANGTALPGAAGFYARVRLSSPPPAVVSSGGMLWRPSSALRIGRLSQSALVLHARLHARTHAALHVMPRRDSTSVIHAARQMAHLHRCARRSWPATAASVRYTLHVMWRVCIVSRALPVVKCAARVPVQALADSPQCLAAVPSPPLDCLAAAAATLLAVLNQPSDLINEVAQSAHSMEPGVGHGATIRACVRVLRHEWHPCHICTRTGRRGAS
jgi:hypothetical protein